MAFRGKKRVRISETSDGSKAKRRKNDTLVKTKGGSEVKTEDNEGESDDGELLSCHALSEYELNRLENIRKNEQMLQDLKLAEAKMQVKELFTTKQRTVNRGLQRPRRSRSPPGPRRQSLRILGRNPEGDKLPDIPVPEVHVDEHRRINYFPRMKAKVGLGLKSPYHHSDRNSTLLDNPRKPAGPLEMVPANSVDESCHKEWLKCIGSLSTKKNKVKVETGVGMGIDLKKYTKNVKSLRLNEEHVIKIVPERIFSIAVHPTESKTLIFAGDKWGHLGVWDVNSKDGQDGVYLYEPHSRPINCLKFHPLDSSKLYSCGYDGTIRCCDLNKEIFLQTYASEEDFGIRFNSFGFICNSGRGMLIADSEGDCSLLDLRTGKLEKTVNLHRKSVRGIDCHPTNENLFASGSVDAEVALWDIRKLTGPKSKLAHYPTAKAVSSVYFSPLTGNKLLSTAMDDYIRIHNVENEKTLTSIATIRHNNQTGRWLTKFRASWDPKTDNCFVTGSMARPRQMEIFTSDGKGSIISALAGENMTSVASITEFHPTKNVVVGGNSSGRVFLWE